MFSDFNSSDIKSAVWKSKDYPNGVDLKKIIYNGTMVWHAHIWQDATCTNPKTCSVCGVTDGEALGHLWDGGTVITSPSCTASGVTRYKCLRCSLLEDRDTPAALGHSWNTPTYAWQGYDKCVATRICRNDSSHPQTSTATYAAGRITSKITTPATCTTNGVMTYTATFPDSWAGTNTAIDTDTIKALGHNWYEPTYSWTDDYTACTATLTCKSDSSHVETVSARITSEITTPATYDAPGVRTYTAIFPIVDGLTNQTKTEVIPKLEKLKFELNSDSTGYTVRATSSDIPGAITIPDTYNGLPVESIPYRGFYNCTGITSLNISVPGLIMDKEAFANCTNMTDAYIELRSIGELAFSNCSNLSNVNLDTCSIIGVKAFDQCDNINVIDVYQDYWRLVPSDTSVTTNKLINTSGGDLCDALTPETSNYKWIAIGEPEPPILTGTLSGTQVNVNIINNNEFPLTARVSLILNGSTTLSESKIVGKNGSALVTRGISSTISSCTATVYFDDVPELSTTITMGNAEEEESSSSTVV